MISIRNLVDKVRYAIAYDYLHSKSIQLSKKHPQLAVYAFDHIGHCINLQGRHEDSELKFLEENIFPRINSLLTDCLDIGANIGNHACALANSFRHVYAFEPNLRVFNLLRVNAELRKNISAFNIGASSDRRTVRAFEAPTNLGGAKITDRPTSALETHVVEFSVAPIDDLLRNIETGPISFIKIDVEGHEVEALQGAVQTLKKYSPVITFEQRKRDFYTDKSNIMKLLMTHGYSYFYYLEREKTYRTPENMPLIIRRLGQFFESLIFGLPSETMYMRELSEMSPRYYSMIIASKTSLVLDEV